MATRMQQRRGTAAQWTAANPILAAGEIGFETDSSKFKMGNGSSAWSALTYFANAAELAAIVDAAPETLNTLNELAAAINDDPAFFTSVTTQMANHVADSTNVHGIADMSALATTEDTNTAIGTAVSGHNSDTLNVHGIADTAQLATQEYVTDAIGSLTDDYTLLGGVGITWNTETEQFDVDNTIATASALADHASDSTNVHGIADMAALATTSATETAISTAVSTHNDDTTNVHGIADTAALATTSATATAISTAVSTHNDDTTNVHGIADTSVLATATTVATAKSEAITAAGTAADSKVSTAVASLTKSSVGLGNVDNTADSAKPVSTAQASAISTAKSEAIADATSQVTAVLNGAPAAFDTLKEIADYIATDQTAATAVTSSLALKAPLASPTFTGTVTVAAAGVAFTDGTQTKEGTPSRTPIIQKSGAYTLSALTERDSLIEVSAAGAITIPADSTLNFPIGTSIDVLQTGTGTVSIAAVAGVTANATPGLTLRTEWSSATLLKRAANTWVVFGDLK